MILPQETIRKKRDGVTLDDGEIESFIESLTDGSLSEGQAAAFAMAVFFRGMSRAECVALTRAMTGSGRVLSWDLPGPVLDKHSTGGVGDTVSLMLAPLIAACGGYVPMISGRGLGATGGTLDKLDSIAGYRSQPDEPLFRNVVRETGCAIIGQTDELAPADKRLYAIRDVTATVESVALITASILSKKLAAGLDGLAMDVKFGNGAFMATLEDARALKESLVAVSTGAGLPISALLTDMNQPLASSAGNAVEVAYAIDYLTGARREAHMHEVVLALGAEMLLLGTLAETRDEALAKLEAALAGGAAAERFARMVAALGGPGDLMERPAHHLKLAPVERAVVAPESGYVVAIDTRAIGVAIIALGGGRVMPQDSIDHGVGITRLAALGSKAGPGEVPLGIVHARSEAAAERAASALMAAYRIGAEKPDGTPLIVEGMT